MKMSAIGTKRTWACALHMSAFGGIADKGAGVSASPRPSELPEDVFGCSGVSHAGFLDCVE